MNRHLTAALLAGLASLTACASEDATRASDSNLTDQEGELDTCLRTNPRYRNLTAAGALEHYCTTRTLTGQAYSWDAKAKTCTASLQSGDKRVLAAATARVRCIGGDIAGFEDPTRAGSTVSFGPITTSFQGTTYRCGSTTHTVSDDDRANLKREIAKFPFSTHIIDVQGVASNTTEAGTSNEALAKARGESVLQQTTSADSPVVREILAAFPHAAIERGNATAAVENCKGLQAKVDCKSNEAACMESQRARFTIRH
jgi:hypothetical protein